MARRLTRKGGDAQVTPDALLSRRGGAPVSIGAPVSVAKQRGDEIFSLFGSKGVRSVFDELTLEMKPCGAGRSAPRVEWKNKIWTVSSTQKDYPKNGISSTSLFTETRKMGCPSFSIPAGPVYEMGTCPAANHSKKGGLREEGKTFVCDGCYSLEGNYIFPNVAIAQAARLMWLRRLLEGDPTGASLARAMASAIEDYARNATLSSSPDGLGSRLVLELGVQEHGRLVVPVKLPEIKQTRKMPVSTFLPPESGFEDTDAFRRAEGVPDGAVTGFFRIHDSGDLGALPEPAMWKAYLQSWVLVAEALPHVLFWAPTRMWMWKGLFKNVALPKNLAIRPSALHVDDEAPRVDGLIAGSAVLSKEQIVKTVSEWSGAAGQLWPCPVYGKEDEKSCIGAGCRACWIWKRTPVAYRWH